MVLDLLNVREHLLSAAPRVVEYRYITNISDPLRRPRGLMDKASDFGSEDCEFESRRGRDFFSPLFFVFCQISFGTRQNIKNELSQI